jgi:hypothetical protein
LGEETLEIWLECKEERLGKTIRAEGSRTRHREKPLKIYTAFGMVEVWARIWRRPRRSHLHPFCEVLGFRFKQKASPTG